MSCSAVEEETVVVGTEDVVEALMDYFLDPILPSTPNKNVPSPLSLQQSVADQMRAVVLLYNYYHRKQFPKQEFLDVESFCKVAVNAKPNLLLQLKKKCNRDGLEEDMSITEKEMFDACNVCKGLDTLKDLPSMEGWPIAKVAVFLTDSMEENCLLLFSPITQGVWSPLEQNVTKCNDNSEGVVDSKKKTQNKRRTKSPVVTLNTDETCLQKLALSAVKETTGIDPKELIILESHVTYSLSEEKTTACLFIMKSKAANSDIFQVPIKDAIDSLQGPLVKKTGNSCLVANTVEYFHLLPYAGIIRDWFSREMLGNASVNTGEIVNKDYSPSHNKVLTIIATEKYEKSTNNCRIAYSSDLKTIKSENLDQRVDGNYHLSRQHIRDKGESTKFSDPSHEKKTTLKMRVDNSTEDATESDFRSTENGSIIEDDVVEPVQKAYSNGSIDVKVSDGRDNCGTGFPGQDSAPKEDHSLVPCKSDSQDLDKLQAILASKGDEMLRAALRLLLKQRNELYHQQRQLEDEIAQCEKNLQTILSGSEDDLMLKIESVIQACNVACSKAATRTHEEPHFHIEEPLKGAKRKRLSEAILISQNPCQELDDICSQNNWKLPRYHVVPSNGGFESNVTVQGLDFECSGGGDLRGNAREARESAAAHILSKLRCMASLTH